MAPAQSKSMAVLALSNCFQVDVPMTKSTDSVGNVYSPFHKEHNELKVLKAALMASLVLSLQWPAHRYHVELGEMDRFPVVLFHTTLV